MYVCVRVTIRRVKILRDYLDDKKFVAMQRHKI